VRWTHNGLYPTTIRIDHIHYVDRLLDRVPSIERETVRRFGVVRSACVKVPNRIAGVLRSSSTVYYRYNCFLYRFYVIYMYIYVYAYSCLDKTRLYIINPVIVNAHLYNWAKVVVNVKKKYYKRPSVNNEKLKRYEYIYIAKRSTKIIFWSWFLPPYLSAVIYLESSWIPVLGPISTLGWTSVILFKDLIINIYNVRVLVGRIRTFAPSRCTLSVNIALARWWGG